MNPLARAVQRAHRDLSELGVPAALIGGLAVSTRSEPRFTRDADLAVSVAGDAEAERVLFALRHRGYAALAAFEHLTTGRLSTVRLIPPGSSKDGVLVDLLFASSGIEPEIVRDAELLRVFARVRAPVARTGHLIALKLLSNDPVRRPQDGQDLRALAKDLPDSEEQRCREAIALITARGFDRGRPLEVALTNLLSSRPASRSLRSSE